MCVFKGELALHGLMLLSLAAHRLFFGQPVAAFGVVFLICIAGCIFQHF